MIFRVSKALFSVLLVLSFHNTFGQSSNEFAPPSISIIDGNNVNLLTGKRVVTQTDLSIGGEMGLSHTIATYDDYFWGFRDDYMGGVSVRPPGVTAVPGYEGLQATMAQVSIGHSSSVFRQSGASWIPVNSANVRLIENSSSFVYTMSDGTEVTYSKSVNNSQIGFMDGTVTSIEYPNGKTVVMHYRTASSQSGRIHHRLQSVTSNSGYQLKYNYDNNDNSVIGFAAPSGWFFPASISGVNNAVEYCNPTADTCSLSQSWPTASYTWPASSTAVFSGPTQFLVTDAEGRVKRYKQDVFTQNPDSGGPPYDVRIVAIKAPSSPDVDTETYDYANLIFCAIPFTTCSVLRSNVTKTSTVFGSIWTYTPDANSHPTPSQYQSDGPEGRTTVVFDSSLNTPITLNMSDGSTAQYNRGTYDSRLVSVRKPNGNKTLFEYDVRGNLTKKTEQPTPNSTLADIVSEADYPVTCSNYKTCNKPTWIDDGRNNRTDFTYHPNSGALASVTSPAPNNGIRPKTRYYYAQRYAWTKNSSGSFVRASTPIWVLDEERFCNKGATKADNSGCVIAGDEVITRYEYGANSGPRNLHLKGVAIIADGQTQRTCYTYNRLGQRVAETLPKATRSSCN